MWTNIRKWLLEEQTNQETDKEFKSPHVLVKERRLKWTGLILRMCCTRTIKKLLEDKQGGRTTKGREELRWMNDV